VFFRAVLLVVAAAGIGCRSGSANPPTDGPVDPSWLNSNGCFDANNGAGIVGCWYSYSDCGTNMTAGQCSPVTTPVPGQPFLNTSGLMCTAGTAAKVVDTAGSAIWGAGIGFDLNNPGTAAGGAGEKLPWDATAHDITGFSFQIDTPPVGGQMRVEFPTSAAIGTTDVNAAYWGGATMNLSPFNKAGDYSFHFTDVGGPANAAAPMPFDKTKILSMHFHVVSNETSTVPFEYCISNLRALKD
jgi:hypothetical protein